MNIRKLSVSISLCCLCTLSTSIHAETLLEDTMAYASVADMRTVWKQNAVLDTDTPFAFESESLEFTGHFPSAGGALRAVTNNNLAYRELTQKIRITGEYGDSAYAGTTQTFYLSYLVRGDQIAAWFGGGSGVALRVYKRYRFPP